jgi:hypothetical protein
MAGSRKKASNGLKFVKSKKGSIIHGSWQLCFAADPRSDLLGRRTTRIVVTFGARGAVGPLGNALSILALAFAAPSGLSRRYSVLILGSGSTFTRIRVVRGGRLTIAANGLTTRILDTICLA